jgi:hypothetical protein
MAWTLRVAWAAAQLPATAVTATTSSRGLSRAQQRDMASSMPGSTSRMTFLAIVAGKKQTCS